MASEYRRASTAAVYILAPCASLVKRFGVQVPLLARMLVCFVDINQTPKAHAIRSISAPIPRYLPKTSAESQGRRLARQKSLPPSVSGLKSPAKPRFRQFFPCETTSRTLNRGRTSSVSGSIGPCVGSLNSQDTHHVRDTLGLPSIRTKV